MESRLCRFRTDLLHFLLVDCSNSKMWEGGELCFWRAFFATVRINVHRTTFVLYTTKKDMYSANERCQKHENRSARTLIFPLYLHGMILLLWYPYLLIYMTLSASSEEEEEEGVSLKILTL